MSERIGYVVLELTEDGNWVLPGVRVYSTPDEAAAYARERALYAWWDDHSLYVVGSVMDGDIAHPVEASSGG